MSEPTPARVSADQLKSWLWNDRNKQKEVAARLFVSDRTIDNWRTGKNPIPDQYHAPLLEMINGQDDILLSFPPDVRERIAEAAKRKGYPTAKSFLEDWLKRAFLLTAYLGLSLITFGGLKATEAGMLAPIRDLLGWAAKLCGI